jgi:hypothetical protein
MFTSGENRGTWKDNANAGIAYMIISVKDSLPKAKDALSKQNNLNFAMGVYFQTWRDSLSKYVDFIFSGKEDAVKQITGLVGEGKFNYNSKGPNLSQLQKRVEAIVFAQMIAKAWLNNPAQKLYPVILEADGECKNAAKIGNGDDLDSMLDNNVAAKTHMPRRKDILSPASRVSRPPRVPEGVCLQKHS